MERRIDRSNLDLDRVAALIFEQQLGWLARGLVTDPLTWADNDAAWPTPLSTDRSRTRRPQSLGVRIHGGEVEARVVVYAGGWCDAEYLPAGGGDLVDEYIELDGVDEFGGHIGRIVACLTGRT